MYGNFRRPNPNKLRKIQLQGLRWESGYVHTNPFSYASVFDPTKTDTNIRVHTSVFESFSTVSTSYEKTICFRSPCETDYRVHDVSVFENGLRFRASTPIRKASIFESLHLGRRFRKPPFSWVKVSVFHRISVDNRRKRIQKYAFSNENGLVWTGAGLKLTPFVCNFVCPLCLSWFSLIKKWLVLQLRQTVGSKLNTDEESKLKTSVISLYYFGSSRP